jgi:misacylated tRNA(Ala) deacylase
VEVLQVNRRGLEAIHFVKTPLEIGKTVKQKINWERRLDHMQQHSGKFNTLLLESAMQAVYR